MCERRRPAHQPPPLVPVPPRLPAPPPPPRASSGSRAPVTPGIGGQDVGAVSLQQRRCAVQPLQVCTGVQGDRSELAQGYMASTAIDAGGCTKAAARRCKPRGEDASRREVRAAVPLYLGGTLLARAPARRRAPAPRAARSGTTSFPCAPGGRTVCGSGYREGRRAAGAPQGASAATILPCQQSGFLTRVRGAACCMRGFSRGTGRRSRVMQSTASDPRSPRSIYI